MNSTLEMVNIESNESSSDDSDDGGEDPYSWELTQLSDHSQTLTMADKSHAMSTKVNRNKKNNKQRNNKRKPSTSS